MTPIAREVLGSALLSDLIIFPELYDEFVTELNRRVEEERAVMKNDANRRSEKELSYTAKRIREKIPLFNVRAMVKNDLLRQDLIEQIDAILNTERVVFNSLPKFQRDRKIASAHRRRQAHTNPQANKRDKQDYSACSDDALYQRIRKLAKNNQPVPDTLNQEMARRNDRYDPKTHRIIYNRHVATTKTFDYTQSSTDSLYHAALQRIKRGKQIPQAMLDELLKRKPTFDATTGRILRQPKAATDNVTKIKTKDQANALPAQVDTAEIQTEKQDTIAPQLPLSDNAYTDKQILSVVVEPSRRHGHASGANRIVVNGVTVLDNHYDTQLRVFLNGQMLGIYGTKGENQDPSWVVLNTGLTSVPHQSPYDMFPSTIREVLDYGMTTRIFMNTNTNLMYEYRYKDALENAFKIVADSKQKTK